MLTLQQFRQYNPSHDEYASDKPDLRLDDLKQRKRSDKPRVSYLISTWNRQAQLARSLECLARQTIDDFEVLLADDGSTQDIDSVVAQFKDFLPITVHKIERGTWRSCPSKAFRHLLNFARGEVIVIAHPEIMLRHDTFEIVYDCLRNERDDVHYYKINGNEVYPQVKFSDRDRKWVSLKGLGIEERYWEIDHTDWHSDVDNLQSGDGFWDDVFFAGRNNEWHYERDSYPWWFCGAALRSDPIWDDLSETETHGVIDMRLITYRHENDFVDITPKELVCYHQAHLKTAPPCSSDK